MENKKEVLQKMLMGMEEREELSHAHSMVLVYECNFGQDRFLRNYKVRNKKGMRRKNARKGFYGEVQNG